MYDCVVGSVSVSSTKLTTSYNPITLQRHIHLNEYQLTITITASSTTFINQVIIPEPPNHDSA